MPFSIEFLNEPPSYPYDDPATPEARGVLILGEAKEYFGSSLYQWSKKEYETQWRHAIRALLDGNDRAALITEYVGPQAATHLEWWPMYVVGNSVSFKIISSFTTSLQSRSRYRTRFRCCVTAELRTKKERRFPSGRLPQHRG
jgi:hypothetical protein